MNLISLRKTRTAFLRPIVPITLACFLLLSCGGDDEDSPTAPTLEPEIVSNFSLFQFELDDVSGITTTLSYRWSITSQQIRITHFSSLMAGSARLIVNDVDGTEVYSGDLAADGTAVSLFGTPGSWAVTIDFDDFSGSVGFTLDPI